MHATPDSFFEDRFSIDHDNQCIRACVRVCVCVCDEFAGSLTPQLSGGAAPSPHFPHPHLTSVLLLHSWPSFQQFFPPPTLLFFWFSRHKGCSGMSLVHFERKKTTRFYGILNGAHAAIPRLSRIWTNPQFWERGKLLSQPPTIGWHFSNIGLTIALCHGMEPPPTDEWGPRPPCNFWRGHGESIVLRCYSRFNVYSPQR